MNRIFATSSVHRALDTIRDQPIANHIARYSCVVFHDGELYVRLEEPITDSPVTVITATPAPTDNFFELFFLLDTLKQHNACINLVFTYFGYARQDHPKPNVARSAQVIANCLAQFAVNNITIVHPHSEYLQEFLPHTSWIPYAVYAPIITQHAIDVIIAPDRGALTMCTQLASLAGCAVGYIEKVRPHLDQTHTIALHADVADKRVLIVDDIISTGNTMVQAAHAIMQAGATQVMALATHNLANDQTIQRLTASPISKLWVTNSTTNPVMGDMLTIDIMPALMTYLDDIKSVADTRPK